MPSRFEHPEPDPEPDRVIDTSKRYDVYRFFYGHAQPIVYRDVLIKGTRRLFAEEGDRLWNQFLEIEQANGQTAFIEIYGIGMICEPGTELRIEIFKPSS
jgi:hypothetical protein